MISALLFDFGGTLDSDGAHWLDRTFQMYTQIGLGEMDKTLIKEAFYWADEQAVSSLPMQTAPYRKMMELHLGWQFEKLGLKAPEKQTEAVNHFVRAAEKVLHRNRKTLELLHHAGLKLGVVSNSYGNMQTLCHEFGYNKFLKVIIDSTTEGVSKPDPRIYTLALDRLKLPAPQVLMVGDNFERDIRPCKILGMKTAWLTGDQKRTAPDVTQIDITLRSVEELPERIKSLS